MASRWTHAICIECFSAKFPDRRPIKVRGDDLVQCCYCDKRTGLGIYVRDDPSTMKCIDSPSSIHSENPDEENHS